MDRRVLTVVRLIQKDLSRKVTLKEMAQAVSLSSVHLRALFKAETGMTPAQYQKKLRLSEARTLLETTFLNSREIMVRVGLNDESHFIRDFKRAYGSTPMRYRATTSKGGISSK
jgi:transcriptional regulator GlxA family with amidase domain